MAETVFNGHAIIIGGGMAGLLAVHAVAGHFERVTMLERFSLPADIGEHSPVARRGVPQSRCIHLLMAAGAAAFDELAPGWQQGLLEQGARPFDACADAIIRTSSGQFARAPSQITAYSASRALFEQALRRRLPATVSLRTNCRVEGLLSDPDGGRVRGVRCLDRDTGEEAALRADLVVDASGEGSTVSNWITALPEHGDLQVEKSVVASGTTYVTRWFEMEPGAAPDWHCLSIAPGSDTGLRSVMFLRAELNRWGLVLLSRGGESLPADDASLMDFVENLRDGELQRALSCAKPVSPIYRYGSTSNRMMHFDQVGDWPEGLVAVGDAACTLDPCFGLGMTNAARGAALLRRFLNQHGRASMSAIQFQKALGSQNAEPWRLATGREPDGRPLSGIARLGPLRDQAPSNPEVAHALLAIQHLLRPANTPQEFVS